MVALGIQKSPSVWQQKIYIQLLIYPSTTLSQKLDKSHYPREQSALPQVMENSIEETATKYRIIWPLPHPILFPASFYQSSRTTPNTASSRNPNELLEALLVLLFIGTKLLDTTTCFWSQETVTSAQQSTFWFYPFQYVTIFRFLPSLPSSMFLVFSFYMWPFIVICLEKHKLEKPPWQKISCILRQKILKYQNYWTIS